VFTKSGDKLAASARSVSGFDVYNALEACSEHIEQFGGHKYAAGLTLKEENYEAFKQAFEDVVSNTIDKSLLIPEIKVDMQLDLHQVNDKLWRIIKQFSPFGPGNMTPIFMTDHLKDTGYGKCVGEDDKHLRITVTQSGKEKLVCIGFGLGDRLSLIKDKKPFKAVYSVDENHWQGKTSIQLKLRDIKS
jgi:single-stranded-DNA-specific exonuclease